MIRDEIKKKILVFSDAVADGTAEINIMLVNQNNQRKRSYIGFMLRTEPEDIQAVIESSLTSILEEIKNRTLDKYDLEISVDESIQTVPKEDVIHGDEILAEFSVNYADSGTIDEKTDLSKIKFMVIQIYNGSDSLYLFKRYIQPSKAYLTSQKYILSGGLMKPFREEVITIHSWVDAFLLEDTYYVLNRNVFNSIFAYKDVFKKILDENTQKIKECGLLTDSEQFIKDCETDGRYLPRLTKAILAKGFEEVSKKKEGIPTIIKDYKLSLHLSESGEIIYRGKEDIPELLHLLLRHYVIDALTSSRMIAAAIQEYRADT